MNNIFYVVWNKNIITGARGCLSASEPLQLSLKDQSSDSKTHIGHLKIQGIRHPLLDSVYTHTNIYRYTQIYT